MLTNNELEILEQEEQLEQQVILHYANFFPETESDIIRQEKELNIKHSFFYEKNNPHWISYVIKNIGIKMIDSDEFFENNALDNDELINSYLTILNGFNFSISTQGNNFLLVVTNMIKNSQKFRTSFATNNIVLTPFNLNNISNIVTNNLNEFNQLGITLDNLYKYYLNNYTKKEKEEINSLFYRNDFKLCPE